MKSFLLAHGAKQSCLTLPTTGSEEAALVLEAAGYQTLPGELLKVSERLVEIREAMERLSDHPRYPTGT